MNFRINYFTLLTPPFYTQYNKRTNKSLLNTLHTIKSYLESVLTKFQIPHNTDDIDDEHIKKEMKSRSLKHNPETFELLKYSTICQKLDNYIGTNSHQIETGKISSTDKKFLETYYVFVFKIVDACTVVVRDGSNKANFMKTLYTLGGYLSSNNSVEMLEKIIEECNIFIKNYK